MNHPPCVLMIDDNPADCRLVKEMFLESRSHVDFRSVGDGPTAFDYLIKKGEFSSSPTPDLIVVDLNLPILGGRKILNLVKTHPEWRSIPVVVLSSSSLQEDIDDCLELGAERYFTKPATVEEYLQVIADIDRLMKQLDSGRSS